MKQITLETLHVTLENLHAKLDAKFDLIDSKFEAIDSKFDAKLDNLSSSFDAKIDAKIDDLARIVGEGFLETHQRIDGLEEDFETLKDKVESLASGQKRITDILMRDTPSRAEVRELDHRVVRLEQHLNLA